MIKYIIVLGKEVKVLIKNYLKIISYPCVYRLKRKISETRTVKTEISIVIYIYIYIHTYIYIYKHIYIYVYTHIYFKSSFQGANNFSLFQLTFQFIILTQNIDLNLIEIVYTIITFLHNIT